MDRDFESFVDNYGWYIGTFLALIGLFLLVYILHHSVSDDASPIVI